MDSSDTSDAKSSLKCTDVTTGDFYCAHPLIMASVEASLSIASGLPDWIAG